MASPWKFLARLISPGRAQRPEDGSTETVAQGGRSEIAGLAEAPAEENLDSLGRPTSDATHRHDQGPAISAARVLSEEAKIDGQVEGGDGEVVQAADPTLFDEPGTHIIAAHGAVDIQGAVEVAPRKQRSRGKKAVAVPNGSQVSDTANEMSLDEEIRLLRGQLAKKLKLQNTQLRKMLERFEP